MATRNEDRVLIFAQNSEGLVEFGSAPAIPSTANLYASGCVLLCGGKLYYNTGSPASPSFNDINSITSAEIADNAVTSGKIDTSVIQTREVALTSANIKAMYGNSVELVPGVGGKTIVLEDVSIAFTPGATAYTSGGDIMVGTADKDLITAIPKELILSVADGVPLVSYAKGLNVAATEAQGLPLLITNATGAFATGTTAATVTVRYHLV
jgi:hypothetical protein